LPSRAAEREARGFRRRRLARGLALVEVDLLDVLITHSPPLGILDSSVQYGGVPRETPIAIGSAALRDRLRGMRAADRPRLHIFGHEHDARGVLCEHDMGTVFVNAAAVNGDQGAIAKGGGYVMKEGFRPLVVDIRVRSQPDTPAAGRATECGARQPLNRPTSGGTPGLPPRGEARHLTQRGTTVIMRTSGGQKSLIGTIEVPRPRETMSVLPGSS
jgi:hypothetical protein